MRGNPEPESLRLSGAILLATPEASLVPNVWSFLWNYQRCGEGDPLCWLHPILHTNVDQACVLAHIHYLTISTDADDDGDTIDSEHNDQYNK